MLQENFTTEKVTSLELEANSVELSAFFLQRNKVLVKQELSSGVKATSENIMDFAHSQKTKGKTAIACIGNMQSITRLGILIFGSDFWDPHWKRNSNSVFDSKDSGRFFF